MQFIKHTENWVKGESFEGGMLFIFGLFLLILAFYFWRLAHLPYFKALIVPFLVVGLLWSAAAGIGLYQNTNRLEKFRAEYEKNPSEFIRSEKDRVEGFSKWYRPLLISWSLLIIAGLAIFHFGGGNHGRAIGAAVIMFALTLLMIDHTSENNAQMYQAEIIKALEE
ncbi:MAG: hypothetical protein H6696_07255 [Deferribacteres bacterium]|nr:hypothetical protein [candidate division KSB1 bacterium]MCB9501720.1 hypothetical protein [Deferribacteres bacterium]